jgi:hypothetical protein
VGGLGHRGDGPRASRDPRPARRLPSAVPSGRGRLLAGGVDAGYRDAGAPGPRTVYGPDYYGGFLLDPDGNSAEAVHTKREDPVFDGRVDHLWIRVRDPAASKRFYVTIAPHAGLRIGVDRPDHVQMVGENFSFSLIDDGRRLTEHVREDRARAVGLGC